MGKEAASDGRSKWYSLAAINIGNFVPPLDTGILIFLLPVISISLNAPVDVAIWVPLTSLLVEASFMPIFGRLGDKRGRKQCFIIGLLLFSIGSFLAGNSLTIYEILIYRVVQGLGGAFILSNGRALIADTFSPAKRGFAFGTHVTTIYIAQTLGPALAGGVITVTSVFGWRYIFYISGAIAAACIPIALIFIRESPKQKSLKVDWIGALLFAAALSGGLATITQSASNGINSTISAYIQYIRIPIINFYIYTSTLISIPTIWIAVAAVVAAGLFLFREKFSKSQVLIDPKLFTKNRIFLTANTAALLLYIAHYGSLFLMSFYLQIIRGFSPLDTGLILMVEPLSVTIFAMIGGKISDRAGTRDPSVVGLMLTGSGLFLFSLGLSVSSSPLYIILLLGTIGAGVGLFAPSNTDAALSSLSADRRGVGNGVLGMMRHSGQAISLAVGTIFVGYFIYGSPILGGTFQPQQYVGALQLNFLLGAILAFIAAPIVWKGEKIVRQIAVHQEMQ
jgi:MFS family permease